MPACLALDIGGTKINTAWVSTEGRIEEVKQVVSTQFCSREQLFEDIDRVLRPLLDKNVIGLAIGFPGLVDFTKGVIIESSLFPCVENFKLCSYFEKEYNLPTYINIDGNLFALAMRTYGEGQKYENFLALILGTGAGIGLVQNGRIVMGNRGIPELCVTYDEWKYHSGFYFREYYGATGEELMKKANLGDRNALNSFKQIGKALAVTIRHWVNTYPLESVILGGGISQSYHFFKRTLHESLGDLQIDIVVSKLSYPVLLGGAVFVLENIKKPTCKGVDF